SAGDATATTTDLNTAHSFTVSAMVKLSSTTQNAAVVSKDGANESGFYLGYDAPSSTWRMFFTTADSATPTWQAVAYASGVTTNWTHLVAVYNAATGVAQLWVNGTQGTAATGITGWNANGPFVVGRDMYETTPTNYFPGEITNVRVWNFPFTAGQ